MCVQRCVCPELAGPVQETIKFRCRTKLKMKLQLLHRCSTRAVAGLVKGCSKIGRNIVENCSSCVASADYAVMSVASDAAMDWEVLDPAVPADFAAAASCEFCAAPAELVFLEIGLLGDSLQMFKACCRHAARHLLLMQDLPAERLARRADGAGCRPRSSQLQHAGKCAASSVPEVHGGVWVCSET